MYLIPAIAAGPEYIAQFSNGINYLMYAFMQSIQFVAGVFVLYSGVRLLLNELVPAFRGIAMRIVPDAKPALDCPVLFPYAPNAVIVGFLATTVGSIIGMLVFPMFGLAMILPGLLTNFFAGGTAGVFGNALGGRRGGDDWRRHSRPVYHLPARHFGTDAGKLRFYRRHLQRFGRY
ncbi:integral membrane protein [Klebsiella michiganensis]|uniref:Ascorbate-specific PTS system EIIC component n=1 Tax=Klebsiella michiganensis TaxID=1134687 RepID=A0A7H4PEI9_9ENTR|nr:integral membrane protein [Klebsiella michiganensis]